jgi:hypothetical protein
VAGGFLLGLAYLMLMIWIAELREGREPIAAREPLPALEPAMAREPGRAAAPIVPSL